MLDNWLSILILAVGCSLRALLSRICTPSFMSGSAVRTVFFVLQYDRLSSDVVGVSMILL